jgi:hypothetical protein
VHLDLRLGLVVFSPIEGLKAQHGIGFRLTRMEFRAFESAGCTRDRAKMTASAGRIDAVVQSLFSGRLAAIHVESDSSPRRDAHCAAVLF